MRRRQAREHHADLGEGFSLEILTDDGNGMSGRKHELHPKHCRVRALNNGSICLATNRPKVAEQGRVGEIQDAIVVGAPQASAGLRA
jgi:phosphoribosyl-dephospho-CoA transferase